MLKKRTTPLEEQPNPDGRVDAAAVSEPAVLVEPFAPVQTAAVEPELHAQPTMPDTVTRLERLEHAYTELTLAVQELRATLQNIVPRVMQGRAEGETLMYLQALDNRIGIIERYLRMLTAS